VPVHSPNQNEYQTSQEIYSSQSVAKIKHIEKYEYNYKNMSSDTVDKDTIVSSYDYLLLISVML
jgi:hypothetical protein